MFLLTYLHNSTTSLYSVTQISLDNLAGERYARPDLFHHDCRLLQLLLWRFVPSVWWLHEYEYVQKEISQLSDFCTYCMPPTCDVDIHKAGISGLFREWSRCGVWRYEHASVTIISTTTTRSTQAPLAQCHHSEYVY